MSGVVVEFADGVALVTAWKKRRKAKMWEKYPRTL
jgi:hypothetical protein